MCQAKPTLELTVPLATKLAPTPHRLCMRNVCLCIMQDIAFESYIRSLKALGVNPDSYGAMLSSVLLNKLPPELRLIISRQVCGPELDLDTLMKKVEEELTARERTTSSAPTTFPRRGQDKDKSRSTATALVSGSQSLVPSPICCYCQQPHSSIDCSTVLNASARRQVLRTSGRCFNCLRKGHLGRDCRSANRCRKCKKKHHSSICEGLFPDQQRLPTVQSDLTQPANVPISQLNPEATPDVVTPTSSNVCSDNRKIVLLQTARAHVYNPSDPHRTMEVRLLLDGGSQRSYITDRVKKLLTLKPSGEHRLSIAAFGSSRERPKVCPIVNVGLAPKGYSHMHLSLFVVPMICEPLAGQPISTCIEGNPHLASLDLADFSEGTSSLE